MTEEKAKIKDIELQKASEEGMDAFVDVFVKHTYELVGGELTADNGVGISGRHHS